MTGGEGKMRVTKIKLILNLLFLLSFSSAEGSRRNDMESGAPCKTKHSLRASRRRHGDPRLSQPPIRVTVTNELGNIVKYYEPKKLYSLNIDSDAYFRGFLIQPRLATHHGFLIGHLRGGYFVKENTWTTQGIKYQPCAPQLRNSITNRDFKKPNLSLRVKWRTQRFVGPIIFYMTLFQEQGNYWERIRPKGGFLLPRPPFNPGGSQSPTSINPSFILHNSSNNKNIPLGNRGGSLLPQIRSRLMSHAGQGQPPPRTQHTQKPRTTGHELKHIPGQNFSPNEMNELRATGAVGVIDHLEGEGRGGEGGGGGGREPPGGVVSHPLQSRSTLRPRILHTQELDVKKPESPKKPIDPCLFNPCYNGGSCMRIYKNATAAEKWKWGPEALEEGYYCNCAFGWTGQNCLDYDFCVTNDCQNNATCISNITGFTCNCSQGWAGPKCSWDCPIYLCRRGGLCYIDALGNYMCRCPDGYGGPDCEDEIDECLSDPCEHGATCEDRLNDYHCHCLPGFMGKRCHRACQDIYKTCDLWDRQNQCSHSQRRTTFFDINCSQTCETCIFLNETVKTENPIPPVLEALGMFVGVWETNTSKAVRFPIDFDLPSDSYHEVLTIIVTKPPMFGSPFLNYTSVAKRNGGVEEKINNGFLTLRSRPAIPKRVALMTTGNEGVTVIEEGTFAGGRMRLIPKHYIASGNVYVDRRKIQREYRVEDEFLKEIITTLDQQRRVHTTIKFFYKKETIPVY